MDYSQIDPMAKPMKFTKKMTWATQNILHV